MSIFYKGLELKKLSLSVSEAAQLANLDRDFIRTAVNNGLILVFVPSGRIHKKILTTSLIDFLIANSFNISQLNEVA